MWFVYHIMRILLLVEPCYRTKEKVSSTRFLVSSIMCYVTSDADPLRDEIDDFCKQLILNNVSYSAKGICNISRHLISTIIGSITTIIVFLYQL
ncbi:gustatory receptor for sugar taste 43a-like [Nymphalis io]|uniref:gustatory receptor for sugar taste 43a-like n=1 Tax=Inachis io TaxID=171585 RepID=UPI00216A63B6|nr:gustatory receptor for sugar taste 43a-like [Nymphalis io]